MGRTGIKMKLDWKEDGKRLLGVLAGGFLMALNLKSFVSAGGLLPGAQMDLLFCCKELPWLISMFPFHFLF